MLFLYSPKKSVTPSCPMDGGTIIQKDITPNRMELFHRRQTLITPKRFVVTFPSKGNSEPQPYEKCLLKQNRATWSPHWMCDKVLLSLLCSSQQEIPTVTGISSLYYVIFQGSTLLSHNRLSIHLLTSSPGVWQGCRYSKNAWHGVWPVSTTYLWMAWQGLRGNVAHMPLSSPV